jgi:hypothetical protein
MADPTGGGILSSVFNMQNAVTLVLDVALFAWMHFTPEGMVFGAGVAEALGFAQPLAETAGVSEVVASTGEVAYAL